MPPPAGSVRNSLIGTLADGEIFDTSFWTVGPAITNEASANAQALAVGNAFQAANTNVLALLSTDCRYTQVKVYHYAGGSTKADYVGEHNIGPFAGTSGQILPLQTCCVVTLRTGFAGRSMRGRMYLPATGVPMQAGHWMDSTTVDGVASDIASLFNGLLNAEAGVPSVFSDKRGTLTPISQVTVDNRADIQRRRANRQSYTHEALSPVGS